MVVGDCSRLPRPFSWPSCFCGFINTLVLSQGPLCPQTWVKAWQESAGTGPQGDILNATVLDGSPDPILFILSDGHEASFGLLFTTKWLTGCASVDGFHRNPPGSQYISTWRWNRNYHSSSAKKQPLCQKHGLAFWFISWLYASLTRYSFVDGLINVPITSSLRDAEHEQWCFCMDFHVPSVNGISFPPQGAKMSFFLLHHNGSHFPLRAPSRK